MVLLSQLLPRGTILLQSSEALQLSMKKAARSASLQIGVPDMVG